MHINPTIIRWIQVFSLILSLSPLSRGETENETKLMITFMHKPFHNNIPTEPNIIGVVMIVVIVVVMVVRVIVIGVYQASLSCLLAIDEVYSKGAPTFGIDHNKLC